MSDDKKYKTATELLNHMHMWRDHINEHMVDAMLYGTSAITVKWDEGVKLEPRRGYQGYFAADEALPENDWAISHGLEPQPLLVSYKTFEELKKLCSEPKAQEFTLLEMKTLREILDENPEASFDLNGDLFRTKDEIEAEEYSDCLVAGQLHWLGDTVKVDMDELENLPFWVIRRNLGR